MLLRVWRLTSVMLTSLLMSMGFAHLWQLPPRLDYDGPFWFETLSMYRELGPGGPGPIVEVAALVSVVALVFLVRRRPRSQRATLVAAACLIVSFGAWWLFVFPVNQEMLGWSSAALPADWERHRLQWEYTHAARALLMAVALGALVVSLLIETPLRAERPRRAWPQRPRPTRRRLLARGPAGRSGMP